MSKSKLRKDILKIRNKKNKSNIQIKFEKIVNLLKKKNLNKKIIGGYFPVNYEVDNLSILKKLKDKNYKIALPIIKKIMIWIFMSGLLIYP